MRILRVATDLYPEVIGGIGVHAHRLSEFQAAAGHRVTLLAARKSGDLSGLEPERPYNVIRCSGFFRLLGNAISLSVWFRLAKLIPDSDIVHAHSHLFYFSNTAAVLSSLKRRPYVITIHGLYSQLVSIRAQGPYMRAVGASTLKLASSIICLSRHDKSVLCSFGVDPDKVVVIPEGVDTETYRPVSKSDVSGDRRVDLLSVGRLVRGKGFDLLLRGFALASRKRPDVRLIVVGEGPLRARLMKEVHELGLDGRVVLIPRVNETELLRLYQRSDIFILMSRTEGLPRVILEAMAAELPVIASSLPQLRDQTGGAGIMADPEDPVALSEAIIRLVDDPELRRELGRRGRERVKRNFEWNAIGRRTTDLFAQILENAHGLGR